MRLEDHIQRFVRQQFVEPARRAGQERLVLRVEQVHQAMGLQANYAEIARVLSDPQFESYASVRLLRRRGPHMGAELEFEFALLPQL